MAAMPVTPVGLSDEQFLIEVGRLMDAKMKAPIERQATIDADFQKLCRDFADQKAAQRAELEAFKAEYAAEFLKFKQGLSRGPGFSEEGNLITLGHLFTQSAEYKAANMSGRVKVAATLSARLGRKAVVPITTVGSGIPIFPRRVGWFQEPPEFPLVMRDVLDVVPLTGTNAVEYVIETWTGGADYQVNEGDVKAVGGVTYADKTAVVRTIAWYVKISRQMLADVPFVETSIDQRLVYGVLQKEDREILYGDGTAGHLLGIMPQATAAVAPPSLAPLITNQMDQIASAIAQISAAGYSPSAVVMNPLDWAGMTLAKTTYGAYILPGPQAVAQKTLWGVPIVTDYNMTQGSYLVGAFPGNAALFDRETVNVEISFENEDDFIRNLATIRAEERVTLAVFVPQAFVKGVLVAPEGGLAAPASAPAPHSAPTPKK